MKTKAPKERASAPRPKSTKKPKTIPQLKKSVWEFFSLYIRLRDALAWQQLHPENDNGPMAACITCNKVYPALGIGCLQATHFIPGRRNAYLFDEAQVNAGCYNCNVTLNGNWTAYYEVMVLRHGKKAVETMIYDQSHQIVKFTREDLEEKLAHYKSKVQELKRAW